jgi:mono/diheme cytochrome c family protein
MPIAVRLWTSLLFLAVIIVATLPVMGQEDRTQLERVTGKQLEIIRDKQFVSVKQGDRLLLEYRYDGVSHKPYVTQLTSPAGANVLRDAPSDHLHHHGLMFAWRVNDVNFWEEVEGSGREVHDQWRELRIATVEADEDSEQEFSEQAILREQLLWTGPTGDVLVTEERVLTIPATEEDELCVITWQSTFAVSEDAAEVVITGTNYNGLGARFLESMDTGGNFQNEVGGVGVEGTREKHAKWCSYTANVADDQQVTVAMFDARGNSRHPARWFTMDQPFAYLAATQGLHLEPLKITAGQKLTLRYGIGVFEGVADQEMLDEQYVRWQQLPTEIRSGTDRGVIGRYYYSKADSEPVVARIDPCIAFDWSDGMPDDRLPEGDFTAIWEGELYVRQDGQFRFVADANGEARVLINDQVAYVNGTSSLEPIDLESGFHAIRVEYSVESKEPRICLSWESDHFPRETISARYFVHRIEQEQNIEVQLRHQRGREIVERSGCVSCHAISGVAATSKLGPPLNRVSKMGPDYLARWLRDPQSVRPGSRMPAHGFLSVTGKAKDVAAIAAYLQSLPIDSATAEKLSKKNLYRQEAASSLPSGSRNGGRKMFHELGCVACHSPESPEEAASADAPSLADIGAKWPRDELVRFLQDPLLWHPHGRMANFILTEIEAADLAAYLADFQTLGDGTVLTSADSQQLQTEHNAAEVQRGKQLFEQHGCIACHEIEGLQPSEAAAVALGGEQFLPTDRGCLSGSNASLQFALTTEDRLAVAEFLRQRPTKPSEIASREKAQAMLHKHFQCFHCHTRDGAGANLLSRGLLKYMTGQGEGGVASPNNLAAATAIAAPDLSGVGGKLQREWLENVIKGAALSPRPWSSMRMPLFAMTDAERTTLINWFETADDSSQLESPEVPSQVPEDLGGIAVELMGSKGFSCTHCHSLGRHQPTTDTPAPDLAMVGQRISHTWFHRWLDDPARVRPGTPMPAFVRAAPGIAGEDLALQKEILWKYLTTTPPDKMVLAAEPERKIAVTGARPLIVQGRVLSDSSLNAVRGVAIGLPNENSLLFDGGRLAWLGHWRNGFLREVGLHGARRNWEPDGEPVWMSEAASPPLVFRNTKTGDWIAPPQWRGRFGWLDSVSSEDRAVQIEYRLRAPSESYPGDVINGEAGPWVYVTETIEANPPESGRKGYTRRLSIRGVPEGFDLIVMLPQTSIATELSLGELIVQQNPTLLTRQQSVTVAVHVSGPQNTQWLKVPETITYPILQPFTDEPIEPGQRFQPEMVSSHDRAAVLIEDGHERDSSEVTIQVSRHDDAATVDTGPPVVGEGSDDHSLPKLNAPTYAADPNQLKSLADTKAITVPSGYRVERLPLPDDFLPCGIDFYQGKLFVGGYDGEIRIAEDTDGDSLADRYRHFAGTLDQVNNLRVFDNKIFAATAGAVYRIEDRDNDGVGETYNVVSSAWDWSGHPYDWFFGFTQDKDGNLYGSTTTPFERPAEIPGFFRRGSVLRITPDGKTTKVGDGTRYNFGWASNQAGKMYFTVNQGHWNITCAIHEVDEGSHYGFGEPDLSKVKKPIIYVPYPWCRSLTGIAIAETSPSFGPFQGDGFAADYNTRRIVRWTEQQVVEERQGACYAFLDGLDAGPTDVVFGPDGALYIAYMSEGSWYPERARGGVYRVSFEGSNPFAIRRAEITKTGFQIEFTEPVDPSSIDQATCRKVHRYFHEYKGTYHSEEIAHEDVPVRSIQLSQDAHQLTLTTDAHKTPRIYRIQLRGVRSEDGRPLHDGESFITVKAIPE